MQEPGKGEKVVAEEKNTTNEPIDESQLVKVRREKLAALQAAGRDPFKITTFDQTHHSTEIKEHFDELGGRPSAMFSTGTAISRSMSPAMISEMRVMPTSSASISAIL